MPNRKNKNPYQLTPREKEEVVLMYARFAKTSDVIDTVLRWKPTATTGDVKKDRKHVTDAIRTCNPHAAQFSYHISLQARRAEYLSETSGSFIVLVRSMIDRLTASLPDLSFDLDSVSISSLPDLVETLLQLHTLLKALGADPSDATRPAKDFGSRLDEYPKSDTTGISTWDVTRRAILAEAEEYESIQSSQREVGIERSHDDVFMDIYRTFDSIPDFIVYEAWKSITGNYNTPAPSRSRMLKEVEKETDDSGRLLDDPDTYWWEAAGASFEERLARMQSVLSQNWESFSHKDKIEIQDFLRHFGDNPGIIYRITQLAKQYDIDSAHTLKILVGIDHEMNKDVYAALQKVEPPRADTP